MKYVGFFIAGILQLQAATCPITEEGYLGNHGVTSGNCKPLSLPPLAAFGSLSVNQNPLLSPLNRLNPHQRAVTHSFQNFQQRGAVNENIWVDPVNPVRTGPFLGYLCRMGPALTVSSITFFFSGAEEHAFNISTDVVNSATCVVTYTSQKGVMKDYHVAGGLFHDIYYESLTPAIAAEQSVVDVGGKVPISIDGGAVQYLPLGSLVKGRSFQLFFQGALAQMVFFVENSEATPVEFQLLGVSGSKFILTGVEPFTGFIRLAPLSSQADAAHPLQISAASQVALSYYLLPGQTYGDANHFLLQFNKMMAEFLSQDSSHFKRGQRNLPSYTVSAPFRAYEMYDAHRRYIPVRADIATTHSSVTWSYTLSSIVTAEENKTLVYFPHWKYLQGASPGVVNTTPGGDQPLQNFTYETLYVAEAIDGKVTFLEGDLPVWYGPDLFIPSILTFTPPQIEVLNHRLSLVDPQGDADIGLEAAFMLANTGLATAHFFSVSGQAGSLMTKSKPFIDNAKSILTNYLINRTPGSSFFIADRTIGGIFVDGREEADHPVLAGYALLAAAMITEWELKYARGPLWVQLPVLGADNQEYQICDFVDFLWRDVHNPFKDDPDLPYDRYGLIAEDFNGWYGMNAFARVMLKTALTPEQTAKYEVVRDFSEMNIKMTSSRVR